MKKKRLSKSIRKYIRKEKTRIRRDVLGVGAKEKLINEIYKKLKMKNGSPYPRG